MSDQIKQLTLSLTAYGIPNIFKSKRLINKIFWICFVLTAAAATCVYLTLTILGYLSYDVVTIVKNEYKQPAEFPAVTFCKFYSKASNDLKFLLDNKFSRFGYDFTIGTDPDNHFEAFESQEFGRCFRFNSGKNMSNHSIPIKNSTIGGRDDCLQLKFKKNISVSLIFWIHERKSPPRIELWENRDLPIIVNSKKTTYLVVDKVEDSKLDEPYNRCLKDPLSFKGNKTIIEYILRKDQFYHQKNCLEFCFDLFYMKENLCNCSNTSLGNVWKDCFVEKEKEDKTGCTFLNRTAFYKNILVEKCSEYCPLECDSISYSFTINNCSTGRRRSRSSLNRRRPLSASDEPKRPHHRAATTTTHSKRRFERREKRSWTITTTAASSSRSR